MLSPEIELEPFRPYLPEWVRWYGGPGDTYERVEERFELKPGGAIVVHRRVRQRAAAEFIRLDVKL